MELGYRSSTESLYTLLGETQTPHRHLELWLTPRRDRTIWSAFCHWLTSILILNKVRVSINLQVVVAARVEGDWLKCSRILEALSTVGCLKEDLTVVWKFQVQMRFQLLIISLGTGAIRSWILQKIQIQTQRTSWLLGVVMKKLWIARSQRESNHIRSLLEVVALHTISFTMPLVVTR